MQSIQRPRGAEESESLFGSDLQITFRRIFRLVVSEHSEHGNL